MREYNFQWAVLTQDAGDAEPEVWRCIGGRDEAIERAEAIRASANPAYDRVWVACREVLYGPWREHRDDGTTEMEFVEVERPVSPFPDLQVPPNNAKDLE